MTPLRPLSIVHVLAPGRYGGLESVVATLATGQAEAGDRVGIVPVLTESAANHPFVQSLRARKLEVLPVEVAARDYRGERRSISSILGERSADVLHTHGERSDVVDAPVARRLGIQSVSTVHGRTYKGWKGWIYNKIQGRALRSFDAVVAVSPKLRGELQAAGVPADRLHYLPNCWRPMEPFVSRGEARIALGLPPDAPIVGWIGRLGREKAPDVMLRAFATCRHPHARLSFIGTGPLMPGCRRLAGKLGVQERVTFHGFVSDASRYLRAFDVIALTSLSEGSPMILLEAMAAEVPVVATHVGGIPDMVNASQALLVPPGDTTAIATAVESVLTDRIGATDRTLEARRRLDAEFSIENWVRRYRTIYEGGRVRASLVPRFP